MTFRVPVEQVSVCTPRRKGNLPQWRDFSLLVHRRGLLAKMLPGLFKQMFFCYTFFEIFELQG